MATSDLLNELQKDTFKADPEIEKKVVQIVLQQLEDQSGDISGLAVKWYVQKSHAGPQEIQSAGQDGATGVADESCQVTHFGPQHNL